jgi:DNA repair protein RadA/Sms
MGRGKAIFTCRECGHRLSQWAGRCPGCDSWGSIQEASQGTGASGAGVIDLGQAVPDEGRVATGFEGVDRVLGGGLVPASVGLLAGEPGIGKSTLLLQLVANLCGAGHPCLLVSGEESHAQVAARARRMRIPGDAVRFAPGRDLRAVIDTARTERPFLLAVDSIQTIRDQDATQVAGGPSQVRSCADALVGMAKADGIAVLLTGHVTKDGDLAGPRTLEHAVDVVMAFDGDPRSGLRVLSGGKNRFGAEGESAWFEMGARGLREIDPTGLLVSGDVHPGAATALVRSGRRALAVEVQALVGSPEGPARRHAAGLDPRRFSLVAAVLDRAAGLGIGRAELFGAAAGGMRVEDPACDLAIAAAVVSAATGVAPPRGSAFVGEVALTGQVRAASSMGRRLSAAKAAGCTTVFAPSQGERGPEGLRIAPVRHVGDALLWALEGVENRGRDRANPRAFRAS